MGIVGRIIAPGMIVSLHSNPPGKNGGAEVGRSQRVPASVFSEGDRYATNMNGIETVASVSGTARYVGIWVENRIEARGQLDAPVTVNSGETVTFPRGELVLRME